MGLELNISTLFLEVIGNCLNSEIEAVDNSVLDLSKINYWHSSQEVKGSSDELKNSRIHSQCVSEWAKPRQNDFIISPQLIDWKWMFNRSERSQPKIFFQQHLNALTLLTLSTFLEKPRNNQRQKETRSKKCSQQNFWFTFLWHSSCYVKFSLFI